MNRYAPVVEAAMVRLFLSLGERERRLYAAAEAIKLWSGRRNPSRPVAGFATKKLSVAAGVNSGKGLACLQGGPVQGAGERFA